MYNNANQVRILQLDHTSRCNLHCPLCARVAIGQPKDLNSRMPITDLTLDDYKILLEPFRNNNLHEIFHCGNFGDVIVSPTFEDTLYYSLPFTDQVVIATNGSARKPEWWENLVKRCGNKLRMYFSIDGLEDTNHLYRVGSNWNKIIENVEAYINAGGIAHWQFIEFDHNSHQVDQARDLANKLGFKSFKLRSSRRMNVTSETGIDDTGEDVKLTSTNIKKEMGFKNKKTNFKMSPGKKGVNNSIKQIATIEKRYNTFDEYVNKTDVSCKFQNHRTIFVDMEMKLWPCCWFGAVPYLDDKQGDSLNYAIKQYDKNFNDMRIHGWNALNHEFFQKYLPTSWQRWKRGKYKRIYTCGRTCGTSFDYSVGHSSNVETTRFCN